MGDEAVGRQRQGRGFEGLRRRRGKGGRAGGRRGGGISVGLKGSEVRMDGIGMGWMWSWMRLCVGGLKGGAHF